MSSWEQSELRTSPVSDSQMGGKMCPTVNKGKSLSTEFALARFQGDRVSVSSSNIWMILDRFPVAQVCRAAHESGISGRGSGESRAFRLFERGRAAWAGGLLSLPQSCIPDERERPEPEMLIQGESDTPLLPTL
ncbi:hypothetical protein SRHO_G00111370 [Serrasalmus rhombeus]